MIQRVEIPEYGDKITIYQYAEELAHKVNELIDYVNNIEKAKKAVQRAGKTAIARTNASVPTRWLKSKDKIQGTVLDYGCGRGRDIDYLRNMGFDTSGWDPNHMPDDSVLEYKYDTVVCNYVLNTLPIEMQGDIVNKIQGLLTQSGVAYISVRRDIKNEGMTSRGTYQRIVQLDLEKVRDCASYTIYKLTAEE